MLLVDLISSVWKLFRPFQAKGKGSLDLKGGVEADMDRIQVCQRGVSTVREELDGTLMEQEPGCGFLLWHLLGCGSFLT